VPFTWIAVSKLDVDVLLLEVLLLLLLLALLLSALLSELLVLLPLLSDDWAVLLNFTGGEERSSDSVGDRGA